MNKLLLAFLIALIISVFTFGQDSDNYEKNEFYVGYSNQQFDDGVRQTLNGGEVSYTRNIHRFYGIKGNFSAAFGSDSSNPVIQNPNGGSASFQTQKDTSLFNILGGLQIKDNSSKKRVKPFAHILGGVAFKRDKFLSGCSGNCTGLSLPNGTFTNAGIAGGFGGGFDIRVNDKIDIRAIKVDYNPVYTGGGFSNNVRIGVGIVFK